MSKKEKGKDAFYGKGGNDECYTPTEPVLAIRDAIKHKGVKVWHPFDTQDSEFVRLFGQTNDIVYSHKDMGNCGGKDFFQYSPDNWDVMVSNPPFTKKADYFERALILGKPFALLMTVAWLNDARLFKLFREYKRDLQVLWFTQRVKYFNPEGYIYGRPSFASAFLCFDVLHKDNVIVDLNDYRTASKMSMYNPNNVNKPYDTPPKYAQIRQLAMML